MPPILPLLGALILFCLVVWAAQRLTAAYSIEEPIRTTVIVVVVVVAALVLVGFLVGGAHTPRWY